MKNGPVITAATLVALAAAILTLLVAFGVPLTDQQQDSINGLVAIIAPVIVGVFAFKTSTADSLIVEAEEHGEVFAGKANDTHKSGVFIRELDTDTEEYGE